ncbi:MAG: T9SS type A sorting domain-containing protein [Bacteroidetes bacterium]|nr:T9SS type A sorting domain-containing protein [Bacteroidota bacterium]
MKKLYAFLLALTAGATLHLNAQCTVAITSLTVNGLTVNVTSTGTGVATFPTYGWDWGDTQIGVGQTQSHTYTAAGTYNICAYFFDLADTAGCQATACTTITLTAVGVPETAQLLTTMNAFPSPFVNEANIKYTLSQNSDVEIEVFDITGKRVATLQNGAMTAGTHNVVWEATEVNAGVYFIRLKAGDAIITRRIIKQ